MGADELVNSRRHPASSPGTLSDLGTLAPATHHPSYQIRVLPSGKQISQGVCALASQRRLAALTSRHFRRQAVAGSPSSTPFSRETLVENLLTVALGLESPLFAWDAVAERFGWRQDLQGQSATCGVGRLWGSSLEASARY